MLGNGHLTTYTDIEEEFAGVIAKVAQACVNVSVSKTKNGIELESLAEVEQVVEVYGTGEHADVILLKVIGGLNFTTQPIGDIVLELGSKSDWVVRCAALNTRREIEINTNSGNTLLSRRAKTYESR